MWQRNERNLSGGGGGHGSKTFDVLVVLVAERERNVSGGGKTERCEWYEGGGENIGHCEGGRRRRKGNGEGGGENRGHARGRKN